MIKFDLQEAVFRGRFLFSRSPKRLEVFKLVNGIRTSKDISRILKRSINSVSNDLKLITNTGLIRPKIDKDGNIIKKEGSVIFEKLPLIRSIPNSHFIDTARGQKKITKHRSRQKITRGKPQKPLPFPNDNQIIDICDYGESQLYEFKDSPIEPNKISEKIGGFANTKRGGFIFYGVDDNGNINGTDKTLQKFDESIQNSIMNTIDPPVTASIRKKRVMGTEIIVIRIPPWNRKGPHLYKGRTYIRKGTVNAPCKQSEVMKLSKGIYIL